MKKGIFAGRGCLFLLDCRLELALGWFGWGWWGVAGFGFGFADVDAALEECTVFNADACRGDVAGEGAFAADIDAVGGGDVAADLAEDDDFAGDDVGGDLSVAADGDAVSGQVDGALDLAVNEKGFSAGDFALDDEALADGGLIASGSCGAGGRLVGGRGLGRPHGLGGGRRRGVGGLAGFPHKIL